ncbi:MAG: GAF domain-containing protein [Deltaproteobacteria bacterium]|nr:GAF domain-containing protein [Deltaproteobacteria bacterium]
MESNDKMNLDIFKVVCKALSKSENPDAMTKHLVQLLVGALEIKGSTIFVLNKETKELEVLASFGLSPDYLNKGPVMADRGICAMLAGKPIIVRDVNHDDRLQYPDDAKEEGIGAIVSICIPFHEHIIGGLRLYHHKPWDISDHDLDYLFIMVEHVGLAMMFSRVVDGLRSINETMVDLPEELALFLGEDGTHEE